MVPAGGDVGAVISLIADGTTLIVADLKAKHLLEIADLPEAKNAVILNTPPRTTASGPRTAGPICSHLK
jgi:hypothetical protein